MSNSKRSSKVQELTCHLPRLGQLKRLLRQMSFMRLIRLCDCSNSGRIQEALKDLQADFCFSKQKPVVLGGAGKRGYILNDNI